MEYLKLAPDIDTDPALEEAGWAAARVYELLLKVSAAKDLQGIITPEFQRYTWLAKRWNLSKADLPGVEPEDFIAGGVSRLIGVGKLTVQGQCWVISGWDKFYRPAKSGAERTNDWRKRNPVTATVTRDAPTSQPSHVTPRNVERHGDATPPTPHHPPTPHTPQKKHVEVEPPQLALEVQTAEHHPADRLQTAWNEIMPEQIGRWRTTGKARKAASEAAIERRRMEGPDGWVEVFKRVAASGYCRGEVNGWVANPDWLLRADGKKEETASKVLEGAYDNRDGPTQRPEPDRPRCSIPDCDDTQTCDVWGVTYCYPHIPAETAQAAAV